MYPWIGQLSICLYLSVHLSVYPSYFNLEVEEVPQREARDTVVGERDVDIGEDHLHTQQGIPVVGPPAHTRHIRIGSPAPTCTHATLVTTPAPAYTSKTY